MKKIIDFNKNWVVIMTLFLGMCFVSSCSSDNDGDTGDLNEYEKAFVGTWQFINNDTYIIYLEFRSDRTGKFTIYQDGKLVDSENLKNWMATDKMLFVTFENGKTESEEYTRNGDQALIGDVLYQKK